MTDDWRRLKLGDRIRFITWPEELSEDKLHDHTRRLYKWLIATRHQLTISETEDGVPWARIEVLHEGEEQTEYLLINHGGFEIASEDLPPGDTERPEFK